MKSLLVVTLIAFATSASAAIKPQPILPLIEACPWVVTNGFIAALKRLFYPNPSVMN